MAILFLTGCLEPGKDGVGDYTRALAFECARQKNPCHLIALNDFYVTEPIESIETIDEISISLLRLPSGLNWEKRSTLACAYRSRLKIDWVSLQFVSYSFNHKGIVRGLARYLNPIVAGCPLHVMFHETWIGLGEFSTLKQRFVGKLQRHFIRDFFRQLNPRLVTTSNSYYRSLLQDIGIQAIELSLFGNIKVSRSSIPAAWIHKGICDDQGRHPGHLLGLFFGTLNGEWKEEPFMSLMAKAEEKTGKRAMIISVGRLGEAGKERWESLKERHGHVIDFFSMGECPPEQISSLLQVVDFGLATTPWYVIGKSGATAAMLDHGLPVIVTNYDFLPARSDFDRHDPLLYKCDAMLETKLWAGLPRHSVRNSTADIAQKLLKLFEQSSSAA